MFFDYDHTSDKTEYYETLHVLMERWENEIVEFKEAKGSFASSPLLKLPLTFSMANLC